MLALLSVDVSYVIIYNEIMHFIGINKCYLTN